MVHGYIRAISNHTGPHNHMCRAQGHRCGQPLGFLFFVFCFFVFCFFLFLVLLFLVSSSFCFLFFVFLFFCFLSPVPRFWSPSCSHSADETRHVPDMPDGCITVPVCQICSGCRLSSVYPSAQHCTVRCLALASSNTWLTVSRVPGRSHTDLTNLHFWFLGSALVSGSPSFVSLSLFNFNVWEVPV